MIFLSTILLCLAAGALSQETIQKLGESIVGNEEYYDNSVSFVSMSRDGKTCAISGMFNSSDPLTEVVKVFKYNDGNWIQLGYDIRGKLGEERSNLDETDMFGNTIALSSDGTIVAISSDHYDNDPLGKIVLYRWFESRWERYGLDIQTTPSDVPNIGQSVDISGDGKTIVVGVSNPTACHVGVFKLVGGEWVRQGQFVEFEIDTEERTDFHLSISNTGDVFVVGVINESFGNGRMVDVHTYKLNGNTWVELGGEIEKSVKLYGYYGNLVSISGDGYTLAVGHPTIHTDSSAPGYVKIYSRENTNWILDQVLFGLSPSITNFFGTSIQLSYSGSTIVIGAPEESTEGSLRGRVYVYRKTNGVWDLFDDPIDGDNNSDFMGETVAVSGDGNVVAVGSPYALDFTGYTKIYELTPKETLSPTDSPTKSPTTPAPTKSPITPVPTKSPTTPVPTKSPTTPVPTQNSAANAGQTDDNTTLLIVSGAGALVILVLVFTVVRLKYYNKVNTGLEIEF